MKFVIPYTITDEEYIAFNDHHLRHTPYGRKRMGVFRLMLILLSVCFISWNWSIEQSFSKMIAGCIICGVAVIPSRWWILHSLRRQIRKSHKKGKEMFSSQGELTVDFEAQTIVDKNEKITLDVPLSSVAHYYETDSAFYIYIHEQSAFIIPHRLFLSTDELFAFRECARSAFQK